MYVECRKKFLQLNSGFSVCVWGAISVSVWCSGFCFRKFGVRMNVV